MFLNLSDLKNIADSVQSLATVFALIVDGVWSYLLFVRKRQKYPRAKIDHQVLLRTIDERTTLVSIDIIISNIGDVLLSLVSVDINVRQVLPAEARFLRLLNGTKSRGRRLAFALFT